MTTPKRLILLLAVVLMSCSSSSNDTPDGSTPAADAGQDVADVGRTPRRIDTGSPADMTEPDSADATVVEDLPPIVIVDETEPNDAATFEEVDDLAVGAHMRGNIAAADIDAFLVDARPGTLYRATITLNAGSQLQPHITVFDAGRDGEAAGDDYVKIVRGTSITFLGMGEGGDLVVVRDARNVDGASVGGADYGYTLVVEGFEPALEAMPLTFGTPLTGALDSAGGVDLWSFDATDGMDVIFDFDATGELDGRLFVFSITAGSWIARQDNRSAGDPNPLLDAPLFGSGPMYLVVESIAEQATSLGYRIDATSP